MQKIIRVSLVLLLPFILLIGGCATTQSQSLREVQVGMDKADVLDKVGNPTRTGRKLGQDRWTYEHDSESGRKVTYIYLENGKVTHVDHDSSPTKKEDEEYRPID